MTRVAFSDSGHEFVLLSQLRLSLSQTLLEQLYGFGDLHNVTLL